MLKLNPKLKLTPQIATLSLKTQILKSQHTMTLESRYIGPLTFENVFLFSPVDRRVWPPGTNSDKSVSDEFMQ